MFVEQRPEYTYTSIYLYSKHDYYTIHNGNVVANKRTEGIAVPEPSAFLQLPTEIFKALIEGSISYAENINRIDSASNMKGQINRFNDEINFLRNLIEYQIKK